jgi:hypothetical protein
MIRSPVTPETPRSEPEILPPDRSGHRPGHGHMRWESINQHGTHRVYVTRLGPFSLAGFGLLFGVIVAAVLALFLGAVLIALPVVFLLVAAAVIAGLLRPRLPQRRW